MICTIPVVTVLFCLYVYLSGKPHQQKVSEIVAKIEHAKSTSDELKLLRERIRNA
jgi:hypothetical protein